MTDQFLYGLVAGWLSAVFLFAAIAVLPHGHNHCGLCGERFQTLEALEAHMRDIEGKEVS